MKTILKGTTSTVTIDIDGPMTVIGESINPTRRKKLPSTIRVIDLLLGRDEYSMRYIQNYRATKKN